MPSPPRLSFLDLPHIVDAISNHLGVTDLLNSALVSHTWHNALIPRLWQDVVTFRIPPPQQSLGTKDTYRHCFLTPESHKALAKYAHHIRALTCRGNTLLPYFLKAGLSSLRELAYVFESKQHTSPGDGLLADFDRLDQLLELIAASPILNSLSIKITDNELRVPACMHWQLDNFLDALDVFPSITSLYLGRL